jgi:glutathione S-transferase
LLRPVGKLLQGGPDDEFGVDWAEYPAIGAWLERLKAMPGWAHPYDMMPGHPLPRT